MLTYLLFTVFMMSKYAVVTLFFIDKQTDVLADFAFFRACKGDVDSC